VRPWRWLHGAAPRRCDLIATYAAAITAAWATYDASGSWVLAAIAADVGGGVVANATASTARWYAARGRPVHVAFVGMHVLHVVLAAAVGGASPVWATAVFVFAAASVVLVRSVARASALAVASALVVIGSVAFPLLPGLAPFVPLFLLKLVVGFGVHARRDAAPAPAPTLGC
jgi:hypothetical protein